MSLSGSFSGDESAGFVPAPSQSTAAPGPASNRDDVELPLVDLAVLQDLEEQLAHPAVAQKFARDYATLWSQRHQKLAAALNRQDAAGALDAVISMKIASAMVGGLRLSRLAEQLEEFIRKGDLEKGHALIAAVELHGSATVKELRDTYILADE
ncbi:Hpt domain-containing protein [Arthrobacter sp. ISL-69]|uniref:Hpt domain-containing protein n=1 Tax=Arthrobacter sp. ISL-69 TaxID=2819113 RepID=UPI001BE9B144|nr:Hpt domain-containing protein [Arthrobacter sp. ISL-69]MBT2537106.1 Hpt domain-containing protein [Arthrobacter sp. ISL-69]